MSPVLVYWRGIRGFDTRLIKQFYRLKDRDRVCVTGKYYSSLYPDCLNLPELSTRPFKEYPHDFVYGSAKTNSIDYADIIAACNFFLFSSIVAEYMKCDSYNCISL